MRLADWRKQQGYTQQQLADQLETTQGSISFWERANDPQLPSPDFIRRIFALTAGAVAPNDFYDLPAIHEPALPGLDRPGDAPLLAAVNGGDQ